MRTRFVEATQGVEGGFNWGKFMVGLFGSDEWLYPSEMSVRQPTLGNPRSLLRSQGWTHEHALVVDLATGEGAMFRPGGMPSADLQKHKIWVCPMFEPFLAWLYAFVEERKDTHVSLASPAWWFELLPPLVELPDAPAALAGYRREGVRDA